MPQEWREKLGIAGKPIGRMHYLKVFVFMQITSLGIGLTLSSFGDMGFLMGVFIILMSLFFILEATGNRLADIGCSRHFRWLYLIPVLGTGLFIYALVKPGKNN